MPTRVPAVPRGRGPGRRGVGGAHAPPTRRLGACRLTNCFLILRNLRTAAAGMKVGEVGRRRAGRRRRGLCTALGERLLGLFRRGASSRPARPRRPRRGGGPSQPAARGEGREARRRARRRPGRAGPRPRPGRLVGGPSRSEEDLDRDRSESETARCSDAGDDRADQCSALASPWTESQCVGSLLSCRRMGTRTKSFSQTEPSFR